MNVTALANSLPHDFLPYIRTDFFQNRSPVTPHIYFLLESQDKSKAVLVQPLCRILHNPPRNVRGFGAYVKEGYLHSDALPEQRFGERQSFWAELFFDSFPLSFMHGLHGKTLVMKEK